jgi:hypothetical protein
MIKKILLALMALGVVFGLSGCATYAQPDPVLRGVAYTGGAYDQKTFEKCVEPGANETIDWGGKTYYYPVNTRTFVFSNLAGADAPPISVSTNNNQELIQGGAITFTLDTSCTPWDELGPDPDGPGPQPAPVKKHWPGGKIQAFNETFGIAKGAYFGDDSATVPQGWKDSMNIFLGGPANRTMDGVGGGYSWQQLYSDKTATDKFIEAVKGQLPGQIKDLTGGNDFYLITSIQLDKPEVSGALKSQLEQAEASTLGQSTADKEKAFADKFGGWDVYQSYLNQKSQQNLRDAQARCYNEGRCNAVPVGVNGG